MSGPHRTGDYRVLVGEARWMGKEIAQDLTLSHMWRARWWAKSRRMGWRERIYALDVETIFSVPECMRMLPRTIV